MVSGWTGQHGNLVRYLVRMESATGHGHAYNLCMEARSVLATVGSLNTAITAFVLVRKLVLHIHLKYIYIISPEKK